MNNNNYIRKIDELGRVVIPKELRKALKIQDNENIRISLENNKINISKYSYLDNYLKFMEELCQIIEEIYKCELIIKNREKILYSNYKEQNKHLYSCDIINDSIIVGKVELYSNDSSNNSNIVKLIARIISAFTNISWT